MSITYNMPILCVCRDSHGFLYHSTSKHNVISRLIDVACIYRSPYQSTYIYNMPILYVCHDSYGLLHHSTSIHNLISRLTYRTFIYGPLYHSTYIYNMPRLRVCHDSFWTCAVTHACAWCDLAHVWITAVTHSYDDVYIRHVFAHTSTMHVVYIRRCSYDVDVVYIHCKITQHIHCESHQYDSYSMRPLNVFNMYIE